MEFNKAYSRQEFVRFLQNSFLPEDFVPSEEEVWFRTKMTYSTEAVKLGTCQSLELVVYEIKHRSRHDARVSLSKEAFRMLADEMKDRALVVFVPEDSNENYRFSLIEITLDAADDSARGTKRYSNPRRYSYFLGEGIAYYTPNKYLNEKGRVASKEDLLSRFSVEVLTKEFYQELSDWYAWAIKIIRFPNDISETVEERKKTEIANKNEKKNDKYNNEGTIRLITRLIFVWFLKQRHLIPDEFFDEKYIADHLIKDFNPYKMEGLMHDTGEVKYYTAILQNLFFAMLNSPITPDGNKGLTERHFRKLNEQGKPDRSDYDNNKLMRYESYFTNPQLFVDLANKTVPFLNGGLFDCLDDKDNGIYFDGFSDSEKSVKLLNIPDFLFFIPEENVDLSVWYNDKRKKRVKVRGLINILKRYNFTVEENTPFDKEVSLDPELLGKVFENLLASFNPETHTTARKQTGSFYTPREIVQYMVDESLIAHLKRTVGEELEAQYRQLMQYSDDEVELTSEQRKNIMQSLYNCKILDPACGSGAFPMGILQQMVHILNRIDPSNDMWKTMMRNVAIERTSEAYMTASDEERNEIINDIERSFDESINRPDYARKLYLIENCIYGVDIQPIAIQISKLRFFISLVVDQNTNTDPTDNFGIRPLPNLEAKFVAANTLIGLVKKDASLFDSAEIKTKENELKIAKHKIFGAKTVKTKRKYKNIVNNLRQEIADMLYANGAVGNDEARQLASWDMFDQNASSPFFDPEWMFGVKEGFDIVIGNPPYGANLSNEQKEILKVKYDYLVERIRNSYLYFMGVADKLSSCGIISYIVPNEFLFQIYMSKARLYFLTKTRILKVLNLGELAFDAVVPTCICILDHNIKSDYEIKLVDYRNIKSLSYSIFTNIEFAKVCNKVILNIPFNTFSFDLDRNRLLNKLLNQKFLFFDYCINIFNGISTSCNDVYILPLQKIKSYNIENEFVRPTIKGEHVQKYYIPDVPPLYILYIDSKMDACKVPNTSLYLEKNKELLIKKCVEKRNGSRRWFELFRSRDEDELKTFPKIIIRQTGDSIIAAIDNVGYYAIDSTNIIVVKSQYYNIINYLLAILNSKLINFYYQEISQENGRVLAQVKPIRIKGIPMPRNIDLFTSKINSLVDVIMANKRIYPNADTKLEENKIDQLIYHLYDLTYDEVLIVDPQTPITREEYEKD